MSHRVYDPRKGEFVVSNNPALILGEMLRQSPLYAPDGDARIAELADHFDEPLAVGETAFRIRASDPL